MIMILLETIHCGPSKWLSRSKHLFAAQVWQPKLDHWNLHKDEKRVKSSKFSSVLPLHAMYGTCAHIYTYDDNNVKFLNHSLSS